MPNTSPPRLYILAGDASGGQHAAHVVAALRQLLPEVQARGLGGDELAQAGMELAVHNRDVQFMGFVEVLKHLGTIRGLFRRLKADILDWRPDVLLLVDYPGFNLRMAQWAERQGLRSRGAGGGNLRTVYYIAPQAWAWKSGRAHTLARTVDELLCILPFEPDFFRPYGVAVRDVGHPLLEQLPAPQAPQLPTQTEAPLQLALLPGSRRQEIARMLPVMLQAAGLLQKALAPSGRRLQAVVAGAASQDPAFYHTWLDRNGADQPPLRLVHADPRGVLAGSHAALVTSGTATLETALLGVPQVVCYAGGWLSYQIARRLVKTPAISLVNLIVQDALVPELIQNQLTAPKLVEAILPLLADSPERHRQLQGYKHLRSALGPGEAGSRADHSAAPATGSPGATPTQQAAQRLAYWLEQAVANRTKPAD